MSESPKLLGGKKAAAVVISVVAGVGTLYILQRVIPLNGLPILVAAAVGGFFGWAIAALVGMTVYRALARVWSRNS